MKTKTIQRNLLKMLGPGYIVFKYDDSGYSILSNRANENILSKIKDVANQCFEFSGNYVKD